MVIGNGRRDHVLVTNLLLDSNPASVDFAVHGSDGVVVLGRSSALLEDADDTLHFLKTDA